MLLLGKISDGDCILHRCGNPQCHNPYHLYIGGSPENSRDTKLHATSRPRWGNLHQTYYCGNDRVEMRQPLVLSKETCWISSNFGGFSPGACFHVNWLAKTTDGYLQLHGNQLPSELVGAHRKIYELFCGRISKYDIVEHLCGDITCLNPYHITITGQSNIEEWNIKYDKRYTVKQSDKRRKLNFAN